MDKYFAVRKDRLAEKAGAVLQKLLIFFFYLPEHSKELSCKDLQHERTPIPSKYILKKVYHIISTLLSFGGLSLSKVVCLVTIL